LHAVDIQRAGLRAAAADLDAVAEYLDVRGLAEHAMVKLLAARRDPLQQLDGSVDGNVFLIAGDEKRNRSLAVFSRLSAIVIKILQHGSDAAGDAALHVDRTAAIQDAVIDVARDRAMRPCALISRRHHIGMAGKGDM